MDNLKLIYFNNCEEIREEWLRFENNAVFYYFQSFLWLSEWYSHIGRNTYSEPFIIAVYRGNVLLALFPFCIERKYGIYRLLTWMGGKLADYNAPIFSNLLLEEERKYISILVIKELCEKKDVDILLFPRTPEYLDDGKINPMINIDIIGPCTHPEDYLYSPYLVLKDWESIYMKVNKRKRSVSSKFRRRFSDLGTVEFILAKNLHEVEEVTKVTITQKAERLFKKVKINLFKDSDYINFYINTGLKAFNEGYLHLSWLKLNGEIIATHWGILFNNRLYWLVPSFNYNYQNNAPGRLLLEEIIHWCCENKVKCFDFCLGDEPYKNDWTDTKMILYRYLKPLTLRGFVFDKLYRKVKPLLKKYRTL